MMTLMRWSLLFIKDKIDVRIRFFTPFLFQLRRNEKHAERGYNCEISSFRFSREVKLVYRGQLILWSHQWNSGYSSILLSFEVLYPSSSPIKTSHGLSTSFASASKLYGLGISEKRLRRTICSQRPGLAWKTHASKLPNRRLYNLHCTLLIV